MTEHRIAILPGDGTGREVAQEAVRLLETISEHSKHGFELTQIDCGGQHFKEVGVEWAEGSFDFCKNEADAIFLGAIGHPGSYLPNGDLAGGTNDTMEALTAGTASVSNVGYLLSVSAQADTASCDLEILVASV